MKGYIYMFKCNISGQEYVGSTVDLAHRLAAHICGSRITSVAPILSGGNYSIITVLEGEFADRDELFKLEQEHINLSKARGVCINKRNSHNDSYYAAKIKKACEVCGSEISRRNIARHMKTHFR
jgi:hypothetical protein